MSYNNLLPVKITNAVSMAASITSAVVFTQLQDNIGFQLNWAGTPTGTFDFQVSMDHLQDSFGNVLNAGNWISLSISPPIAASGSADTAYIDLNQLSAPYVRIVYTRVSGSGNLTIYTTAKGI